MSLTFAQQIDRWDHLNRTLKPLISTMPELAGEQQQLEALILQAKAMQTDQGASLRDLREAIRQRRQAELTGQDLFGRIAAVLKGKLGFKSNDLYGFGLTPRKARRKKTDDTPTPPPPPVEASAPHEPKPPADGPAK